ncbi:nucleoside-diphosphate kinase [Nanchangia anserum]|uniref:Nucleoside diphosphate kinase n=1 Tax=Nanchangia anserum TaxID=2692125 RepID=A0A8I0GDS2_9ACTO|nr:nucleoside-diphosphate kinase [Nanchangia anserum]MBD3689007.1 nucleoside-diphosphate kinase [Nanchangia anserum]QOX81253.1 nucleoside-diphosphate kinase [Nanchangia anserum]
MTRSALDPNTEHTLILIKPDAYRRGLVGEILARCERKGYVISALSVVEATPDQLEAHYAEHVAKHFYADLARYMMSSPLVAAVITGEQVVAGVRCLTGGTQPTQADPGTIRGDYGRDWGSGTVENVIHASDSPASAEREIAIWFPELVR